MDNDPQWMRFKTQLFTALPAEELQEEDSSVEDALELLFGSSLPELIRSCAMDLCVTEDKSCLFFYLSGVSTTLAACGCHSVAEYVIQLRLKLENILQGE